MQEPSRPQPRGQLSRRAFLGGSLAAIPLVAAACGGGSDDDSASEDAGGIIVPDGVDATALAFLVATFPDGLRQQSTVVAGAEQRIAFVVADLIDNMRETAPATIDLTITTAGDSPTTVFSETVDQRVEGIITPYYPATLTFDAPGAYVASLPEYPDVAPLDFIVVDATTVAIPQVGEPLPAVPTPTFDDALGVDPLCTRAISCPFHEIDLVDALANDLPTVLLVATPGFCQTDICGPVVDLLIDEAEGRDDLNVIHLEVYTDPSIFETGQFPPLVPAVDALALPFEPALFVADADGIVAARLDTTFDRSELRDALALL